ncbi:MAG: hypothetical protein WDW38_002128 [Sanguina aurantia]
MHRCRGNRLMRDEWGTGGGQGQALGSPAKLLQQLQQLQNQQQQQQQRPRRVAQAPLFVNGGVASEEEGEEGRGGDGWLTSAQANAQMSASAVTTVRSRGHDCALQRLRLCAPAVTTAAKLQLEASQLVSENEVLQEQLDTLLSKVDVLQNQNGAMKAMLLQACHSSGIAADIHQLNASLQLHRPPPVADEQAITVAAALLGFNNGQVLPACLLAHVFSLV